MEYIPVGLITVALFFVANIARAPIYWERNAPGRCRENCQEVDENPITQIVMRAYLSVHTCARSYTKKRSYMQNYFQKVINIRMLINRTGVIVGNQNRLLNFVPKARG